MHRVLLGVLATACLFAVPCPAAGAASYGSEVPAPSDPVFLPEERLPPFTGGTPEQYYARLRTYLRERHPGIAEFDPSKGDLFNTLEAGCGGSAGVQPRDPWRVDSTESTGGIRKVFLRPLRTQPRSISVKVEIRPQVAEGQLQGFDPQISTWFSVGQRFDCGGYGRRVVRLTLWKMVKRGKRVPRLYRIWGRGTSRTFTVNGDAYGGLSKPVMRTVRLTDPGRKTRRRERWLVGISSGHTKLPPAGTPAILRVSARSRTTPYLRNPVRDNLLNQG